MLEWKDSDEEKRTATFQKWMMRFAVIWALVIIAFAIVVNSGCGGDDYVPNEDASVLSVDAPIDSVPELKSCMECPQIIDILCHCEGGGPPFDPEAHCTCENGEQCQANTCEP